jgi:hypothetical protein
MTKRKSINSHQNYIKRSQDRSHSDTLNGITSYESNTISLLVGSLLLFVLFSATALPGLKRGGEEGADTVEKARFYPTIIPSIQNASICLKTERKWEDGKCWDAEHSPNF